MSYILEALEISEQTRQQRVAGLHYALLPAVEEGLAPRPFRPFVWLLGALLINATAMALWWRPAPGEMQIVKTSPGSAQAAPKAPAPAPASIALGASITLPVQPPIAQPSPAPVVAVVAKQLPAPVAAKPAAHPEAKLRAASPDKPNEAATSADNGDSTPASLMKQLPPINVAGYIRDAESNRLVMINDRLLHEGEELAPGLKLEKILDDSLVFNFRGHRFKR